MHTRELVERRDRLIALAAAQRIQLGSELLRLRRSFATQVSSPIRKLRTPVALALGVVALLAFRRKKSAGVATKARAATVAAAAIPLAALWLSRARLAIQVWRMAKRYWPHRSHSTSINGQRKTRLGA